MFTHFIITRFNVKFTSAFAINKRGERTDSIAWLERRFDLFDTYCFPAVKEQTCKDFIWLVLFDSNTPPHFRDRIDRYKTVFDKFIPVYIAPGSVEQLMEAVRLKIKSLLKEEDNHLITSRVDNDDAISKDYVKEVQTQFERQNNIFLNFNVGYQYDINKGIILKVLYKNNHFTSRIEHLSSTYETVFSGDHRYVHLKNPVKEITTKPLWMAIVHEGNLLNRLSVSFPQFTFRGTDYNFMIVRISIINSIIYSARVFYQVYIKALLRPMARPILNFFRNR